MSQTRPTGATGRRLSRWWISQLDSQLMTRKTDSPRFMTRKTRRGSWSNPVVWLNWTSNEPLANINGHETLSSGHGTTHVTVTGILLARRRLEASREGHPKRRPKGHPQGASRRSRPRPQKPATASEHGRSGSRPLISIRIDYH